MYYCTTEMDFVALLPLAKPAHRLTLSSSILILLHVICCISGLYISFASHLTHKQHTTKQVVWFFVFFRCSHFALPTFREILKQQKWEQCSVLCGYFPSEVYFHNILLVFAKDVLNTPLLVFQCGFPGAKLSVSWFPQTPVYSHT